jgi:DNA-directed RNA polymerase subunit RPC12/RpoP
MGDPIGKDLQKEIGSLVAKAYDLLYEVIEATKLSDQKAKSQNAKWWDRHRLHVLLDAANDTIQKLPLGIIVAPWFLAEFRATLEIIERWKNDPAWSIIEPSLKDKDTFKHSIAMLRIAEHFKLSKHIVEIVPTEADATPDLRVKAIGGTQDWIYIECIQPNALTGEPIEIPEQKLDNIVERSMVKAKRQFETKHPGILAILSYNQTGKTIEGLKQKLTKRLDETDRPYLAGFVLLDQSILFEKKDKEISFTPIVNAEFISNPSYFGRIDIISENPNNGSKLKKVFDSIKTDDLQGKINATKITPMLRSIPQPSRRKIKEISLSVIEEPKPSSRTIIQSKKGKIFVFFEGEGNIRYKCGNCQAIIAERIWNLSINGIVVLCPSCRSYNEFPQIRGTRYPLKGIIGLAKQTFDFDAPLILKQGVTIRQEETQVTV